MKIKFFTTLIIALHTHMALSFEDRNPCITTTMIPFSPFAATSILTVMSSDADAKARIKADIMQYHLSEGEKISDLLATSIAAVHHQLQEQGLPRTDDKELVDLIYATLQKDIQGQSE
ncbi:MAG: hypothetical protein OXT67_05515 [Zetaproteobacteria bacterium]|nr:hypothetical protein [Zetaproteobacteria bacterium]